MIRVWLSAPADWDLFCTKIFILFTKKYSGSKIDQRLLLEKWKLILYSIGQAKGTCSPNNCWFEQMVRVFYHATLQQFLATWGGHISTEPCNSRWLQLMRRSMSQAKTRDICEAPIIKGLIWRGYKDGEKSFRAGVTSCHLEIDKIYGL